MIELSDRYPGKVEWGILLSESRQDSARYPSQLTVAEMCDVFDRHEAAKPAGKRTERLSAHLCGNLARVANSFGLERSTAAERSLLRQWLHPIFDRVQVNTTSLNPGAVARFGLAQHVTPIGQWRSLEQPSTRSIAWLFDRSGGRGVRPAEWPKRRDSDPLFGFAGGIGPDNVMDILERIDARGPYWIDMESGVRDDSDRFSLERCADVLGQIYG